MFASFSDPPMAFNLDAPDPALNVNSAQFRDNYNVDPVFCGGTSSEGYAIQGVEAHINPYTPLFSQQVPSQATESAMYDPEMLPDMILDPASLDRLLTTLPEENKDLVRYLFRLQVQNYVRTDEQHKADTRLFDMQADIIRSQRETIDSKNGLIEGYESRLQSLESKTNRIYAAIGGWMNASDPNHSGTERPVTCLAMHHSNQELISLLMGQVEGLEKRLGS